MPLQQLLQSPRVAMRVDQQTCPRKPRAVYKARMVEAVAKNRVAGTDQRGYCSDVGRIAAGEHEGCFRPLELGDRAFEVLMGRRVAAHQGRCGRAPAESLCGRLGG